MTSTLCRCADRSAIRSTPVMLHRSARRTLRPMQAPHYLLHAVRRPALQKRAQAQHTGYGEPTTNGLLLNLEPVLTINNDLTLFGRVQKACEALRDHKIGGRRLGLLLLGLRSGSAVLCK